MLIFPHGFHVDRDGNVWVTDAQGSDGKGHQVFKFSPDGKLLLTLGKAGVAGAGHDELNQPSDVAVAPNGDIFVADGHDAGSNMRIVKYTKDGKFIKTLGQARIGAGRVQRPARRSLSTRRAGCSSPTAPTTACRSSTRTGSSSRSGSSSAV